ncbi:16S rRNA (guanine(527)-N(7))-methyltransferase RsmG [Lactovum odontotermitis]
MQPEEFYQDFQLSDQQRSQFAKYFELLIDWNEKINLTAITLESEVYLKHFYDSVMPVKYGLIPNKAVSLLDIGAGAGFPSLPLKILYPELKVTIIDSLNKRINFLSTLIETLGLENVQLLHGRAEDFGQNPKYRAQFDFVTARAVARLNVLSELTLPFLKKNGELLAYKASKFGEEVSKAKPAVTLLGGKLERSIDYKLPDNSERHIAVIKKVLKTPGRFPRKAGTPNRNPL